MWYIFPVYSLRGSCIGVFLVFFSSLCLIAFFSSYFCLCYPYFPFQHWKSVQDNIPSAHHPRDRRRGDRLLTRPGPVRALPQGCGASVGGGSGPQRHWTVQPVSGAPAPLHRTRVGSAARLTATPTIVTVIGIFFAGPLKAPPLFFKDGNLSKSHPNCPSAYPWLPVSETLSWTVLCFQGAVRL